MKHKIKLKLFDEYSYHFFISNQSSERKKKLLFNIITIEKNCFTFEIVNVYLKVDSTTL